MNEVTKELYFYGKERRSTALGADIGKGRVKIADPVSTELDRPRKTEKWGRKGDGDVNIVEEYMKNKEMRESKSTWK